MDWLRSLPPALVVLGLGSFASAIFMLFAVTSHTTPVAVLLSAGVVTGLIFLADAGIAAYNAIQSAVACETGHAVALAIAFGIAALVCSGAFSGVMIMILVLNS